MTSESHWNGMSRRPLLQRWLWDWVLRRIEGTEKGRLSDRIHLAKEMNSLRQEIFDLTVRTVVLERRLNAIDAGEQKTVKSTTPTCGHIGEVRNPDTATHVAMGPIEAKDAGVPIGTMRERNLK